jgi:8-oxo-dGTP pyrophosphatase MutT (NUDIX family)
MRPLVVAAVRVGWLGATWAQRALLEPTPFVAHAGSIALLPALHTFTARSVAVARWADEARRRWGVPGWRDERVVVYDEGRPLLGVERAMLRPLGLTLRSVLANVYVLTAAGPLIWVARRAATRPVDPGRLDTLVGGGIPGFDAPGATLVRECAEEAAIPADLARRARRAGVLESCYRATDDGLDVLHRERLELFDLALPPEFVPHAADGEHQSIALMSPAEALASIDAGDWTREGAQATADLILRMRWMPGRDLPRSDLTGHTR